MPFSIAKLENPNERREDINKSDVVTEVAYDGFGGGREINCGEVSKKKCIHQGFGIPSEFHPLKA